MKYLKLFETYIDREDFFNKESEDVTTITCKDNNNNSLTFTYDGKSGDHYYTWAYTNGTDDNRTVITFVRNPGIGTWNPATGTGAFFDRNYNFGSSLTTDIPYEITSRTTISNSPGEYPEEPLVYVAGIKTINAYSNSYGKNVWYEYAGEFDVYPGVPS